MIPQYGIRNLNVGYPVISKPLNIRQNFIVNSPYQNYINTSPINRINTNQIGNVQKYSKIQYNNAIPNNLQVQNYQKKNNQKSPINKNNIEKEFLSQFINQNKSPAPLHKKLIVKLTEEEKIFYNKLFMQLNKNNFDKIDAIDAARFIVKSGLNKEILKNIWLISSSTIDIDDFLEKDEFFVMLRLIALAQNKLPYNVESIEKNNPIPPLPYFNFITIPNQKNNFFEIPEITKNVYKRLFDGQKEFFSDYISDKNAIKIWRSNNFNSPNDFDIKKVIDCLKPLEQNNFLNLKEFQVACFLLAIKNQVEIPKKLPQNFAEFLGRNNQNKSSIIENYNNNLEKVQALQKQKSNDLLNIKNNKLDYNSPNRDISKNSKNSNDNLKKIENLNIKYNNITNQINVTKTQIDMEKNKLMKLYKQMENLQKEQNIIKNELLQIKNNPKSLQKAKSNSFDTLEIPKTDQNTNRIKISPTIQKEKN